MKNLAIGVDIGGTHVTTAVIDLDSNTVLKETMSGADVDHTAVYEEILSTWSGAIDDAISKSPNGISGIGVAMPGPFDYLKGISHMDHKLAAIKGMELGPELQKRLAMDFPVRFINDASAFAVGESFNDQQRKFKKVVAITLGTGFGSAFIDNGNPIVEREDVPEMGCVWHIKYKEGIGDDYFSTRWFVKTYFEKTGLEVKGAKEIADRYHTDENAKSVFDEFAINLAEFLSPWFKKFKTESLIIGGNISRAFNLFYPKFREELAKQGIEIEIGVSELKEEAALIGSARLLDDNYYEIIKPSLAKM